MLVVESGGRRWDFALGTGRRKWMKAAPTFLPVFDPTEKRRTSLSETGRGEDLIGVRLDRG